MARKPLNVPRSVDRAIVSHDSADFVIMHIDHHGRRQSFRLSRAAALTLAYDLAAGPARPGDDDRANRSIEDALRSSTNLPSTIDLPLVTPPISTASMADYPDGLMIELGLPEMGTQVRRVRIPMFADTARHVIGALRERLERIGQAAPPEKPPKPS